MELNRSCFTVLNLYGLRSLFLVLIRRSLGYGIGAGQKICQADCTVLIRLGGLVVVCTCNGKLNIRNNIILGSLDDFKVAPIELVIKAYCCGFAVLDCYSLGRLLHILIRRSFGDRVTAGDKSCKDKLTLGICFCCLIEVGSGYGKLNTRNVAVLCGLNNLQVTRACLEFKDRRHRVGSRKTCDNILLG